MKFSTRNRNKQVLALGYANRSGTCTWGSWGWPAPFGRPQPTRPNI